MIKALIAEDELAAKVILEKFLEENHPDVKIVGYANTIHDIKLKISDLQPNLLFLDIRLDTSGVVEYAIDLLNSPDFTFDYPIIITTAYHDNIDYYQQAFNSPCHVVDYLVKVYSKERFAQAMEKARKLLNQLPTTLAIDTGKAKVILRWSDIVYFKAEKIREKATGRTIVKTNERDYYGIKHLMFYKKELDTSDDLSDEFFCTHDALHNKRHVKEIVGKKDLENQRTNFFSVMTTEEELPIAYNQVANYKKWLYSRKM